jgi:hypothetical protein
LVLVISCSVQAVFLCVFPNHDYLANKFELAYHY